MFVVNNKAIQQISRMWNEIDKNAERDIFFYSLSLSLSLFLFLSLSLSLSLPPSPSSLPCVALCLSIGPMSLSLLSQGKNSNKLMLYYFCAEKEAYLNI